jgi:dihydroxy-acid dehydratase
VQDGDRIEIDIKGRKVELHVSEEEIAARLKAWRRPEPKIKRGYLALYSRLASSAAEGAVIKND